MPQPLAHHTDSAFRGQSLILSCIACLILLSACVTAGGKPGLDPVWITNEKSIQILPPAALAGGMEVQQQIEFDYQGQTYTMQTVVDANSDHFSLYALNSFGTQVFELQYDERGIRYESGLPIGKFKPEYLMADWQLCFFPTAAVRSMVEGAGLAFDESDDGATWGRTVSDNGQSVIEIRRGADGIIHSRNLLRGYAYHITQGN